MVEEEPPLIDKIDKNEKKVIERNGRGKTKNYLKQKKRRKNWIQTRTIKTNCNEGTQIRKNGLLKCKKVKCHNDCYAYKTKECIELHDKLHHSQQERKKL